MGPWDQRVARHITEWSERFKRRGQARLAAFSYHFTDVQNAASILRVGRLLSRAAGAMLVDNASRSVIAGTPQDHTRFVRLYFRPRTPTQWHNEGIRPPAHLSMGSHCPVPVFFLFSLQGLLCSPGTYVSDGNMGHSRVRYDLAPKIFDSIPFEDVYHDGAFSRDRRDEIIFRRHAEVLVRDQLGLEGLEYVACRSEAERQTLLHLVGDTPWKERVYVIAELFHREWFYIESAHSEADVLVVKIHRSTREVAYNHSVRIRMEAVERETGQRWTWEGEQGNTEQRLQFRGDRPGRAEVTVWLEDKLAFKNILQFTDDIPF